VGNDGSIAGGLDHWSDHDSGDMVGSCAVILVPGHDEQAVVCFGPTDVAIDVCLKPGVALLDATIVHIIL